MRGKKGGIEYLSALMLICLVGLLLLFCISSKHLKVTQIRIRDALDTSCLAALLIDKNEYETNHVMNLNSNPSSLVEIFKSTIEVNLNLNNSMEPKNNEIFDKIIIHAFYVYSIIGDTYYEYRLNQNGINSIIMHKYTGNETTPDGKKIVSATIYADIGMNIRSFLQISQYVHIKSSVDVVDYNFT